MKRIGLFLVVLALAAPLLAQDAQPVDYSRNKLIQIFANEAPDDKPKKKVDAGFGYIDLRALNTNFHIGYLPFLMPLYGSMPWAMNGAFGSIPDPFIASGAEIPQTPRTWAQNRAFNAELKRIERTEREKAKKPNATVMAKPE